MTSYYQPLKMFSKIFNVDRFFKGRGLGYFSSYVPNIVNGLPVHALYNGLGGE